MSCGTGLYPGKVDWTGENSPEHFGSGYSRRSHSIMAASQQSYCNGLQGSQETDKEAMMLASILTPWKKSCSKKFLLFSIFLNSCVTLFGRGAPHDCLTSLFSVEFRGSSLLCSLQKPNQIFNPGSFSYQPQHSPGLMGLHWGHRHARNLKANPPKQSCSPQKRATLQSKSITPSATLTFLNCFIEFGCLSPSLGLVHCPSR